MYPSSPESIYRALRSINPGEALLFLPPGNEKEGCFLENMLEKYSTEAARRYYFPLHIQAIATNDPLLAGCIVARRINFGSVGKYTLLVTNLSHQPKSEQELRAYIEPCVRGKALPERPNIEFPQLYDVAISLRAVSRFTLDYYNVGDANDELLQISPAIGDCFHPARFEKPGCAKPSYLRKEDWAIEADNGFAPTEEQETILASITHSIDDVDLYAAPTLEQEERNEILTLEREKRLLIERISMLIIDFVQRHRQMPPVEQITTELKGKMLLGNDGFSRLLVNQNLDIVLPAYNEIQIPLRPLAKALYFLFLLHPEGIRLVDIPDHRAELESLYTLISPTRPDHLVQQSIDQLTDPINNDSLRQQISRIKRVFCSKILNEHTAAQYYISGQRGEAYRIPLSRDLVELPTALTL